MNFTNKLASLTLMSIFLLASSLWAATIAGTVKFEGEAPKFKEIKMDADPICLSHHSTAVYPETLAVGDGNTMANVFVYVKSGLAKKDYPAPGESAELTQSGCMYAPHVFGVMLNQPLKILNPDGTLHNVHVLSKDNPEENIAMPKFRAEMSKTFTKEEFMFPVKCDVHPWMNAYISVMAHPFFSTTKLDGNFSIANLPAGTYEIEAWHEKLGVQTASVTVGAEETKTVDFTFSKPGN